MLVAIPVVVSGLLSSTIEYTKSEILPVAYAEEIPIEVPQEPVCDDTRIECNCYLYLKSKMNLPPSRELIPNINRPVVGSIALFDYNGKPHYAGVDTILETSTTTRLLLDESNFESGVIKKRWIDLDYKPLIGFHLLSG